MSADRIEAALAAAVAGGLPGLSVAARLPNGDVIERAAGVRGLDNPAPMTPDTVFWIASFTKALTTVAVLQLVERGRIDLDAPTGTRWLPALAAPMVLAGFDETGAPQLRPAARPITVRQLLTHRSGLAYPFCHADLARYAAAKPTDGPALGPLMFDPGEGWTYGTGLDWAGELVAAVDGRTLDIYLEDEVFRPLGMAETSFAPRPDQADRLASMHARGEGGALAVIPFQPPPAPNPTMGGGGLYSTAGDYLAFLVAILSGGGPVLSAESVAAMAGVEAEGPEVGVLPGVNPGLCAGYDPAPGKAKRWGLGFVINPEAGAHGRSAGSLAWAGLANCYYWADPSSGAAGVFLAQLLPFGDAQALEALGAFERAVYSA